MITTEEERRQLGALLIRAQDVQKHLALEPKLMITKGFLSDNKLTSMFGYEVVYGEDFGVVVPV